MIAPALAIDRSSPLPLLIQIMALPGRCALKTGMLQRSNPLIKGRGMMKGRLRSTIFERAMAGDTTLLIFLAKTVLGLRESKETSDISVNVHAAACAAVAD